MIYITGFIQIYVLINKTLCLCPLKRSSAAFFDFTVKRFLPGQVTYAFCLYSSTAWSLCKHTVSLLWPPNSSINVQSSDSGSLPSRQQRGGGKSREKLEVGEPVSDNHKLKQKEPWRSALGCMSGVSTGEPGVGNAAGGKPRGAHCWWVRCFKPECLRRQQTQGPQEENVRAGGVQLMTRLIVDMLNLQGQSGDGDQSEKSGSRGWKRDEYKIQTLKSTAL